MKSILYLSVILLFQFEAFSQCSGTEPVVYLGNDTILCQGQSVILQSPAGYETYLWSDGSSNPTLSVNSSGTYILNANILVGGSNLVVNGDFSSGTSGFISDYIAGTGGSYGLLSNAGQYAVSTSPSLVHNNFYYCGDHTNGTGNMYIANGSDIANTIAWQQTIPVAPNTNYNFSAWVTSVENTSSPAILQFFVNDIQIGNVFSPTSTGCDWTEFYNLWNSGTNTSAIISIKNQNVDESGNDFALDDIKFTSYCTNSDTIVVIYDTISIDAGNDWTVCDYEPINIVAVSNESTATYLWNNGNTALSILPDISGTYTITATSENGCVDTDNVNVTINTSPTALFSGSPLTGTIPLLVDFTNESANGINYSWDFGNGLFALNSDLSSESTVYSTVGDFNVMLVASNLNCSDTAYLIVSASNVVTLEEPNVFSPNGDNDNDTFHLKMVNISELEMNVLNRWGEVIFTTTDVNIGWNGLNPNGKEATAGVYTYIYSAKGVNHEVFNGTGFVHLVR